jgi:hypothetical protein
MDVGTQMSHREPRHEMSSDYLKPLLSAAALKDTAEAVRWLNLLDTRDNVSKNRSHDRARYRTYFDAHHTAMGHHIQGGFVLHDGVRVQDSGDGLVLLQGEIQCVGSLYIKVWKRLKKIERANREVFVQTMEYSYTAAIRQVGNVFRYDSPHDDHWPWHHVHRFDVLNGDDEGSRTDLPQGEWP